MTDCHTDEKAAVLKIKLQPRSSANQIVGFEGDALKVKVTSAPVNGSANKHLISFLSKHLKLPRANIEILSGHTARLKIVKFHGIGKDDLFFSLLCR